MSFKTFDIYFNNYYYTFDNSPTDYLKIYTILLSPEDNLTSAIKRLKFSKISSNRISVITFDGRHVFKDNIYVGGINKFSVEQICSLSNLKNKTVRFVYNSGSKAGEVRIVKVTKVVSDIISGNDLTYRGKAPRNYKIELIQGGVSGIEVL
jgi:hypothetical protein